MDNDYTLAASMLMKEVNRLRGEPLVPVCTLGEWGDLRSQLAAKDERIRELESANHSAAAVLIRMEARLSELAEDEGYGSGFQDGVEAEAKSKGEAGRTTMIITPDNGKSSDFGHGRAKTKGLSTEMANYLRQNYYCIPKWCGLYAHSHLDGMGGCWGISMGGGVSGCPLTLGEEYCRECEYHKDRIGENDD